MIERTIEDCREDNAALVAELSRAHIKVDDLQRESADTAEAFRMYVDFCALADDRIGELKKEVEETRWDVLSWGQRYERVLGELVGVKKERDALRKEMGEERNHYNGLERLAGEHVFAQREDVKLWKEKETAHYCDYAAAIGEREALRKENEALKKENAKLDSAWKATAILLGRRSFHDKFPTQMNEGESAKWTDGGSAARGAGK